MQNGRKLLGGKVVLATNFNWETKFPIGNAVYFVVQIPHILNDLLFV